MMVLDYVLAAAVANAPCRIETHDAMPRSYALRHASVVEAVDGVPRQPATPPMPEAPAVAIVPESYRLLLARLGLQEPLRVKKSSSYWSWHRREHSLPRRFGYK